MEKRCGMRRSHRRIGLKGVLWRYLILTGVLAGSLCLAWMILFNMLVNMGIVMSAYTAVRALPETEKMLQAQEIFVPEEIPFFYEWALAKDGRILESNMNEKQLGYAQDELDGSSAPHGRFYTQYFHFVPLSDGRTVLLEYDYSVCYADPKLQEMLPDFQFCYVGLLFVLLALLIAGCTGHYTKILQADAQAVTAACEMVRYRRLDEPVKDRARVKELQASLDAIDTLRAELSGSLKEQWDTEQKKNEALAALAHDLKTPLTVILGNADLLTEDDLTDGQKEMAGTILRSALRAEKYVERLREVTANELPAFCREKVSIGELFSECVQRGKDLSAIRGQTFVPGEMPVGLSGKIVEIEKNDVLRAVENLLSNAVRFTPEKGTIVMDIAEKPGYIGIRIQDSGPGFSPEALAKAGKTFYTQDKSRPQDGHMGMGLYFAARVAKKHGGSLALENMSAGGRVCLWLGVCLVLPADPGILIIG